MPGPSEDAHRAAKVSALAEAFIEDAKVAGVGFVKPKDTSLEEFISLMAEECNQATFEQLAHVHGIRKPSERTVAAVKLYLSNRAKAAAKLPENPLEGLPQ